MKVLSFAFGGDPYNPYLPSRFGENAVVYTGTHDNLPVKGMIQSLGNAQYDCLLRILKAECGALGIRVRAASAKTRPTASPNSLSPPAAKLLSCRCGICCVWAKRGA